MDAGHGAKSGAVAGVAFGVVNAVVSISYMLLMKDSVIQSIQAAIPPGVNIGMPMDTLYNIGLISALPSAIVMGAIIGAVFGVVFAGTREELFGKTDSIRGVSLSVIILGVLVLAQISFPGNPVAGLFMVNFTELSTVPFSAGAYILLGYLTGMFWVRFSEKPKGGK